MKGVVNVKSNAGGLKSLVHKSNRDAFSYSLKYGFTTFLLLLISLRLWAIVFSASSGKPIIIFDWLDFSIASFGSSLIFLGKMLEKIYGKK